MVIWMVLTLVFKSATTWEILTFMNVESNVIINEAQATNINGIQECSLIVSFIY